eukprot:702643_1
MSAKQTARETEIQSNSLLTGPRLCYRNRDTMSLIKAENDPSDFSFEKSESHHVRESHCSPVPPQPSTKAFTCKYCQKGFNLKEHLVHHASESHSVLVGVIKQEEPTRQSKMCEICQKVFKS